MKQKETESKQQVEDIGQQPQTDDKKQPQDADEQQQAEDRLVREKCTVVITYEAGDCESHLLASIRSVFRNLRGVEAEVIVVGTRRPGFVDEEDFVEVAEAYDGAIPKTWLWRAMEAVLPRVSTERIVLMSADMMLLQPCLLDHIGVPKATNDTTPDVARLRELGYAAHCYDAAVPSLLSRSMLEDVINQWPSPERSLRTVYFSLMEHATGIKPQIVEVRNGAWRQDPWLLPVVSTDITAQRIRSLQAAKPFMWLAPSCRGSKVDKMLEEVFLPCD